MISAPAVALGLPAPAEFINFAAQLSDQTPLEIDEDIVDDAAVYTADFLRAFAVSGIVGITLNEATDRTGLRHLYSPILKVAATYGWHVGLGGVLWSDIQTVHIPAGSDPETTLSRIRTFRGALA